MEKNRGGQPGNQNATKHGFYSRAFQPDEAVDLEAWQEALESADLSEEIAMLRVVMRRVFEQVNKAEGGVEEWSAALAALGVAASRLGGMLQIQQRLSGSGDEIMAALSQALREVTREAGGGRR